MLDKPFNLLYCGSSVRVQNMQSLLHKQHIRHNVSDMRCSECRADSERRFAGNHPFHYAYVHQYLEWVRPRLEAIRNGENSVDAQIWHRNFMRALHTRISSHMANSGRKHSDGYLERFQWRGSKVDAGYLRKFSRRGASCLDY